MKYPKINTIWKRGDKGKIIEGNYSCEEFDSISKWYATEKIDGTNIRVTIYFCKHSDLYKGMDDSTIIRDIDIQGRTDNSQIPSHLKSYLTDLFSKEDSLLKAFEFKDNYPNRVIIYGEGYGNKINNGQNKYRKDVSFICFDIWIDGIWLEPDNMKDICKKLKIDYVPEIKYTSKEALIYLVKSGFQSKIGLNKNIQAEGIVVRSKPLMLFRDGTPIKWKLKTRDYR